MSQGMETGFVDKTGCISAAGGGGGGGGDIWPLERPEGMTQIQSLEVMCGKDHMDVHLSFTHPFEGIVFSKGQYGDPRCVYVTPSTGRTFFSFRIAYARCGTKPDLHGQFYENTVVVQYDKDLLEVWDEAKRLRCEWFNDYEKTASKPPMVIADLDVIQLDFRERERGGMSTKKDRIDFTAFYPVPHLTLFTFSRIGFVSLDGSTWGMRDLILAEECEK
ncbi:hypothetical protein RUM43_002174 [Polyplax serrata]|uniref:ZP domain-containing protein n=1 Tax=Polyplax serrata TaxID=468196 RepID=A0AAN8PM04_POLSC